MAVSMSGRMANAVGRNRFKRRIRELFRLRQELLLGWDLHFVCRQKPVQDRTKRYRQEFHEDFEKLCQRLHKTLPVVGSPAAN
jgi:ribonuclease P protein component